MSALRKLERNITQLLWEYEQEYDFSVSGVIVYNGRRAGDSRTTSVVGVGVQGE